ncbi:MAG: hybrid sensor histidine kinase/response regulator [Anaerolineae bacterium]|nr:hybrid sensor histidine kinase/response regulator [Anaerolineae bacterium]
MTVNRQQTKQHILIVDDKLSNLRLLTKILTEEGYTMQGAVTGQEALEIARETPPDLILLDIMMPDMNGYQVCELLKENPQTQDIPVIFISALDQTQEKINAFALGGVDYITKPFKYKEVVARVKTHLSIRNLQRQLEAANKALEEHLAELKTLNSELADRNEELDAFSHTVAHDLKNPLSLIAGYAGLLLEEYAFMGRDEILQSAQNIYRGIEKMTNIINNLLLLAGTRKADVVAQPLTNMGMIVMEALHRLDHMLSTREVQLDIPEAWPTAWGYAAWVEEIWTNYISNAIKYGGDPPHVKLGATEQDNGFIRFWVQDNGSGIPQEKLGRLFVPFERLDQARIKGHGLGLSIVQRIAHKLGGEAGVESEVGKGSLFYFTLPRENPTGEHE